MSTNAALSAVLASGIRPPEARAKLAKMLAEGDPAVAQAIVETGDCGHLWRLPGVATATLSVRNFPFGAYTLLLDNGAIVSAVPTDDPCVLELPGDRFAWTASVFAYGACIASNMVVVSGRITIPLYVPLSTWLPQKAPSSPAPPTPVPVAAPAPVPAPVQALVLVPVPEPESTALPVAPPANPLKKSTKREPAGLFITIDDRRQRIRALRINTDTEPPYALVVQYRAVRQPVAKINHGEFRCVMEGPETVVVYPANETAAREIVHLLGHTFCTTTAPGPDCVPVQADVPVGHNTTSPVWLWSGDCLLGQWGIDLARIASKGHLRIAERVRNALAVYDPIDPTGEWPEMLENAFIQLRIRGAEYRAEFDARAMQHGWLRTDAGLVAALANGAPIPPATIPMEPLSAPHQWTGRAYGVQFVFQGDDRSVVKMRFVSPASVVVVDNIVPHKLAIAAEHTHPQMFAAPGARVYIYVYGRCVFSRWAKNVDALDLGAWQPQLRKAYVFDEIRNCNSAAHIAAERGDEYVRDAIRAGKPVFSSFAMTREIL